MASRAWSTFNFPTLKRSACDRCRKQKLRCPSRASDAQPCSRCTRAGVECITGYTRPLGRSHRSPYGLANSNTLGQSHVFPVAGPEQLNLNAALQDAPTSPSVTKYPDTRSKRGAPDSLMRTENSPTWFFTGLEEEGASFHYPCVLDSFYGGPLLADTRHDNSSCDATNVDHNLGFPPLSPQYIETSGATCSSGTTPGDNTPSTYSPENAFSRTLSGVDCDLRLSQLSVDLCRQAQRNMAANQQSDRTQSGAGQGLTETDTEPQHLSGCPDYSSQSKEFGDALCSTSEFMAVIQSKLDDTGLNNPTERHEAHWPLINLSCVLNLISCYLLIVAVFERLVLRLYEQMICNDTKTPSSGSSNASPSAGPQTLPGLRLASFHVQQSNLQTKILIQIIEHQFEMIERSLGLPVELRLSSDFRDPYDGGLLQNGLDEGLLEAVTTRLCPMSGSLESLRENMMRVKRHLAT
ncbi:hypothetical protein LA080_010001 [Diaporthe eres]|nr:hypothetical protein LA080_010001 [Diaporthe eres]